MNYSGDLINTVNGGTTWKTQRNFWHCTTIDILDSVFIVGGWNTLIYVSNDKGKTWASGGIKMNGEINKIQIVTRIQFLLSVKILM